MSEIQELIRREDCDFVVEEVSRVSRYLRLESNEAWAKPFRNPYVGLSGPVDLMYLADRGLVGFGMSDGLWCQTYENGWARTPPLTIRDLFDVSLVSAGVLSPRWFTGLPFTRAAVSESIPEAARPFVTIEWHDDDDIFPDCPAHAGCLSDPRDIARWVQQ